MVNHCCTVSFSLVNFLLNLACYYKYDVYIKCLFSGNIASISVFNFCGLSITKEKHATTRIVLDTIRTVFVLFISAVLGWQPVVYPQFMMQITGLLFINFGICLYTDFVVMPFIRYWRNRNRTLDVDGQIQQNNDNQNENSALIP